MTDAINSMSPVVIVAASVVSGAMGVVVKTAWDKITRNGNGNGHTKVDQFAVCKEKFISINNSLEEGNRQFDKIDNKMDVLDDKIDTYHGVVIDRFNDFSQRLLKVETVTKVA